MAGAHAAGRMLAAEVERALDARDPGAAARAVDALVSWIYVSGSSTQRDEYCSRWLSVVPVFRRIDLSIWQEDRTGIDTLALALERIDFFRQVDLSLHERFQLLTRLRGLLPPTQHLACANVDLARAELLSRQEDPGSYAREDALAICDDALAAIEQVEDELSRASASFRRATVLVNLDRAKEALAEAEKARAVFVRLDHTFALANVDSLLAEIHLLRDRIPEAAVFSAEAIEGYQRVGDSIGKGSALRTRARTWKARGKRHLALQDCQQAIALLDVASMRTAQGRAMLFLADLESDAGRYDEARRNVETAVEYFRESPERAALVSALLKLAELWRKSGDADNTARFLDEAEAECGARAAADAAPPAPIRARLLLGICRIAKELPTPDKPRIRRASAEAMALAKELALEDVDQAARAYAAYAG